MNKEFLHMQKLAGLITESQYSQTITILEDETIDEGLKDWIIKGLIVLSTLGGIGKVYQMDQAKQQDRKAQMEYYNNVLDKEVKKMSDEQLSDLGDQINSKTRDLAIAPNSDITPSEFSKVLGDYATDYIKAHPNKFAVGVDGGVYQIGK